MRIVETGDVEARLIDDLRALIADLGKNGGTISPSIYDTAQGLRLNPPAEVEPVIEWVLGKQEADGGWGNPHAPRARDIPTIAALLALCEYADRYATRGAVEAGVAFMRKHSGIWEEGLTEDIPVAAEVLMPMLLQEAAAAGLGIPTDPYSELVRLGQRKRAQIAKLKPGAGTPPTFSWEAWGQKADPAVVDEIGSVGHSPAATMAWIRAAEMRDREAHDREMRDAGAGKIESEQYAAVQRYLMRASEAAAQGIVGVYPSPWPMNRFEQSFALYAILTANLFGHPALADVLRRQVDDLAQTLSPTGLGMSDYFLPDGDDTAAAMAILESAGRNPDLRIIKAFEQAEHYSSYPHELQFSLTVTARSIHVLSLKQEETDVWQRFLARQQQSDGRWMGDKWNTSWVYTTYHVLLALRDSAEIASLRRAHCALLEYQHQDGGWSTGAVSNMTETSYGLLALHTLIQAGFGDEITVAALRRAHRWLLHQYLTNPDTHEKCWISKELYRPHRIDKAFMLSALLCPFDSQTQPAGTHVNLVNVGLD